MKKLYLVLTMATLLVACKEDQANRLQVALENKEPLWLHMKTDQQAGTLKCWDEYYEAQKQKEQNIPLTEQQARDAVNGILAPQEQPGTGNGITVTFN